MERLLSAIPGSFNTDWGAEVWNEVGKRKQDESDDRSQDEPAHAAGSPMDSMDLTTQATPPVDRPSYFRRIHRVFRPITHLAERLAPHHSATSATTYPPVLYAHNARPEFATAHIQGNVVLELSKRDNRSLVIYKSRGRFEKDGLWRKRTRECVETTALLVCCANAEFAWFGDIAELLGNIGTSEKTRESSLAGKDQLFVVRWTCLSLIAIRPILENHGVVQFFATEVVISFAREGDPGDGEALDCARKIDGNLQKARGCLFRLYEVLYKEEDLTEKVKEILNGCESEISELERLDVEADNIQDVDWPIFMIQQVIAQDSHGITSQIPGVLDDLVQAPVPFSRGVELSREPLKRQFIPPGQTIKSMCSPAQTLRKILGDRGNTDEYKELLENLRKFRYFSRWEGNEIQRQLLRLQDLLRGGGLGFTVELFFLAFEQLLSTSSSKEYHSALYTGTFRAITSNWNKHKYSLETQKFLLNIAWSRREAFSDEYPTYIIDEFISLLGNIFEGQAGLHIDEAVQKFESFSAYGNEWKFRDRILRVFTGAQA